LEPKTLSIDVCNVHCFHIVLPIESLTIPALRDQYLSGKLTPENVIESIYERIAADAAPGVFIELAPRALVLSAARRLGTVTPDKSPLWGIPFVVKDNIDVLGFNTTAACPMFAYTPTKNATVVQKLLAAGALVLGKTNLDQFATGLVGTRSPYGTPANVFNDQYISGGSSSGSAVAVTRGYCSFALGTDTAGSGRVPAGFGNIVGLKPTKGMLSTKGVVPACASLDCVSIFALTVSDAAMVADVAKGFDPHCPESLRAADTWQASAAFTPSTLRIGVPIAAQRSFCGDRQASQNFDDALALATTLGAQIVEVDFTAFFKTAELLYSGPWVSERLEAAGDLLRSHPSAIDPIVASILTNATSLKATDVYSAQRKWRMLGTQAQQLIESVDLLMVPTTPTIFTHAEVAAEPLKRNSDLGLYTNFANLLDLCGIAVPAGFRADGLPAGVTFLGAGQRDSLLAAFGTRFHLACSQRLGASEKTDWDEVTPLVFGGLKAGWSPLFVVGAHMSGQPLNTQLTQRGAVPVGAAKTAATYRFYALAGRGVARPGLVRVNDGGSSIEGELWAVPVEQLGSFVCGVPAPLCIGRIQLANGASVTGFTCESTELETATDITGFGNWRAYLAFASSQQKT
jgi:allophanate hydrolase